VEDGTQSDAEAATGALLTGSGLSGAAKAAGVTPRTVQRWLRQPAFREALKEAEEEALSDPQRALSLQALRVGVGLAAGLSVRERGANGELLQFCCGFAPVAPGG